jgi:hypothetical protein
VAVASRGDSASAWRALSRRSPSFDAQASKLPHAAITPSSAQPLVTKHAW